MFQTNLSHDYFNFISLILGPSVRQTVSLVSVMDKTDSMKILAEFIVNVVWWLHAFILINFCSNKIINHERLSELVRLPYMTKCLELQIIKIHTFDLMILIVIKNSNNFNVSESGSVWSNVKINDWTRSWPVFIL